MPKDVKHADGHAAIAKMLVEVMRMASVAFFQGNQAGSRSVDTLIIASVFVGQHEGRLMSTTKLSEYAQVPRPTMIRRLAALEAEGVLVKRGCRYAMSADRMNAEGAVDEFLRARRLVIRTGDRLSRMDACHVHSGHPPS